MKKIILTLLVTASIASLSCNKERISGHGPIKTENRQVTGFNQIVVNGSTNVFINYDSLYSVKLKAYSNLLPYMETKVDNNVLTIGYKDETTIKHDNSEAFVSLPQLISLRTNGNGKISTSGIFTSQTFEAQTHGSGDIILPEGSTNELSIVSMGSGDVYGFSFKAKSVEVTIQGSANVKVYCTETLKVTINGSGNVYYEGNPSHITQDITGSGHLIKQ